jgi:hypothetical protein
MTGMDIAAVAIDYLTTETGVPWYHDRPEHAAGALGTLVRDGGPYSLATDMPTLTLMCYGATRGDAADLAGDVKRALMLMPYEVANVFGAEVMGDYYDPLDGYHRHRVTAQLVTSD